MGNSKMPCHEDADSTCQIEHWCVCQWAFASYIKNAGGCGAIQDVVCDSINFEAIKAYQSRSSQQEYQDALDCLVNRCGIDINTLQRSTNVHAEGTLWLLCGFFIIMSIF